MFGTGSDAAAGMDVGLDPVAAAHAALAEFSFPNSHLDDAHPFPGFHLAHENHSRGSLHAPPASFHQPIELDPHDYLYHCISESYSDIQSLV